MTTAETTPPSGHADSAPLLPEWSISEWLNTPEPLTLAGLRGKVVMVHAFQMLCPGCLSHGLPQAQRVRLAFPESDVAVIGLHTVFEHHAVMTPAALQVFNHEYRWPFPIGIDAAGDGDRIPKTMRDYGLRGTPSVIVLDRMGRVRLSHFGRLDDLSLGSVIGSLLSEHGTDAQAKTGTDTDTDADDADCSSGVCAVP